MQNRQSGRRRRGGTGGGNNPRPMGQPMGGQGANRLEVRVRGNANQLLEKYKVLARDAHQAGDRVATEYYLQHADHYFRVLNDSRIRQEEMRARRGPFDQLEEEYDDEGEADTPGGDEDGERGQEPERAQDRNRDGGQERNRDGNRKPRDDRRFEGRSERPQRDADRQPRDADRQPRDGDRQQRWQQDGRSAEGQREGQPRESQPREIQPRGGPAREGQIRESQMREGQERENSGREGSGREGSGRTYQPRTNGSRYAADEARSQSEERSVPVLEPVPMSDGEAALAAFGGPIREPAAPARVSEAAEPGEAEAAPAPRKRGRPRKVVEAALDAVPVTEG